MPGLFSFVSNGASNGLFRSRSAARSTSRSSVTPCSRCTRSTSSKIAIRVPGFASSINFSIRSRSSAWFIICVLNRSNSSTFTGPSAATGRKLLYIPADSFGGASTLAASSLVCSSKLAIRCAALFSSRARVPLLQSPHRMPILAPHHHIHHYQVGRHMQSRRRRRLLLPRRIRYLLHPLPQRRRRQRQPNHRNPQTSHPRLLQSWPTF